jgi:hypothetical protein
MESALKISEVRVLALQIWGYRTPTALFLFLPLWQTLVHQFQRDENVRTLPETIRDAFEFIEADTLKGIQPASTQAKNFDEMLQCFSKCAELSNCMRRMYKSVRHIHLSRCSLLLTCNCQESGL